MADLTAIARILAEDWERAALAGAFLDDAQSATRPFVADWPALVRWRDRVLANPRRHPPDLVAAALEALALECHLSGHPELAARAVEQAERTVLAHAERAARPYHEPALP